MKMRNLVIMLCASLALSVLLIGCSNGGSGNTSDNSSSSDSSSSSESSAPTSVAQGVFDNFQSKGFTIGKETTIDKSVVGATDAKCYQISGSDVTVYYFNPYTLSDKGTTNFHDAKLKGEIDGKKCVVNDNLVMTTPTSKDSQKIVDAFKLYNYQ